MSIGEAQRNSWLIISDGNLVSGLLVGTLRRSEPGLAKGAYVEGFNCKFESFVEGVGHLRVQPFGSQTSKPDMRCLACLVLGHQILGHR